jgi:hypothetical protein
MPSSVATSSGTGGASARWNRARNVAGRTSGSCDSSAARTACGEPGGRVDDQVEEERPPGQPHLRALPLQVGDRAVHLVDGALPHAAAPVEDAVDGRLGQPGLAGDLADRIRVRHAPV